MGGTITGPGRVVWQTNAADALAAMDTQYECLNLWRSLRANPVTPDSNALMHMWRALFVPSHPPSRELDTEALRHRRGRWRVIERLHAAAGTSLAEAAHGTGVAEQLRQGCVGLDYRRRAA